MKEELLQEVYDRLGQMDWGSIEKAMDGYDEDIEFFKDWRKRALNAGVVK